MQNYNIVHSWEDRTEGSPGISEPVSLAELKNYLRLESFVDDQSSTADVEFDSDDDLLEIIISTARQHIEKMTGCALIPKNIRIECTNLAGDMLIPFGPHGDFTALHYDGDDDLETNDIDEIKLTRGHFKRLRWPNSENMVIDYSCGYGRGDTPPLPENLKLAILAQAAYLFEHRGEEDEVSGVCKAARMLAAPFVVESPIL